MPPDDSYFARASAMDREAAAVYRTWVASLPPEQRAHLVYLDLHQHQPDKHRVSGHSPNEDRDPAESSLARSAFIHDEAAEPEDHSHATTNSDGSSHSHDHDHGNHHHLITASGVQFTTRETAGQAPPTDPTRQIHALASPIVQRIIGSLMTDADSRLATGALAFAFDLDALNGLGTPKEWAAKNDLPILQLARKIIWWQQELELAQFNHLQEHDRRAGPLKEIYRAPNQQQQQFREIQRVVGFLIGENNVKISSAALAFALNLDALNGIGTLREWVAQNSLSPEAISKKKRWWEKKLDLPPNAFSKTPKAKAALSAAQKNNHWKNRPWSPKPKTAKPV